MSSIVINVNPVINRQMKVIVMNAYEIIDLYKNECLEDLLKTYSSIVKEINKYAKHFEKNESKRSTNTK
jgi:hypothetical protein